MYTPIGARSGLGPRFSCLAVSARFQEGLPRCADVSPRDWRCLFHWPRACSPPGSSQSAGLFRPGVLCSETASIAAEGIGNMSDAGLSPAVDQFRSIGPGAMSVCAAVRRRSLTACAPASASSRPPPASGLRWRRRSPPSSAGGPGRPCAQSTRLPPAFRLPAEASRQLRLRHAPFQVMPQQHPRLPSAHRPCGVASLIESACGLKTDTNGFRQAIVKT